MFCGDQQFLKNFIFFTWKLHCFRLNIVGKETKTSFRTRTAEIGSTLPRCGKAATGRKPKVHFSCGSHKSETDLDRILASDSASWLGFDPRGKINSVSFINLIFSQYSLFTNFPLFFDVSIDLDSWPSLKAWNAWSWGVSPPVWST